MKDAVGTLTPLGLMVLALLSEGDMHPYEMIRLMRQRRDDRLVSITNGTMYHTVARLKKAGFLAEVRVDRDGKRPERTTYRVTDVGRVAADEWIRRELPRVDHPAEFRIALAESHNLDRAVVIGLLQERRSALRAQHRMHRDGRERALARGVPEQYLIEIEREVALREAELSWLDGIIARLDDHAFAWGPPAPHEHSERYLADRRAAAL